MATANTLQDINLNILTVLKHKTRTVKAEAAALHPTTGLMAGEFGLLDATTELLERWTAARDELIPYLVISDAANPAIQSGDFEIDYDTAGGSAVVKSGWLDVIEPGDAIVCKTRFYDTDITYTPDMRLRLAAFVDADGNTRTWLTEWTPMDMTVPTINDADKAIVGTAHGAAVNGWLKFTFKPVAYTVVP